jgi:phosphoribosylamine--glycine ligase
MKILIIGSGGREHALAMKVKASPKVNQVLVAPGNGGTDTFASNLPVSPDDTRTLALAASRYGIDLTIVGPEGPLANGIVDEFENLGLPIFGPSKEASLLESSKAFARDIALKHNIPSPDFKVFHSYVEGYEFLKNHEGPVVVKADGLASGKGTFVCLDREAAINALYDCMEDRIFGSAGSTVIIEEYISGSEISVFGITDGEHISSLATARDYKRLLDGNRGLNTGGMGSYTPSDKWTAKLADQIRSEIMEPVVKGMASQNIPYKGMLYAGIMLTATGPKLLEFNCRFGDPETQVILPSMNSDIVEIIQASIEGKIKKVSVDWGSNVTVGVVMASRGYPRDFRKGLEINGLDTLDDDVIAFHGGTKRVKSNPSQVTTDGGRVLTIVGSGPTLEAARDKVYSNVSKVDFQGSHYRKDIALIPKEEQVIESVT